jgi:hypothetical protein
MPFALTRSDFADGSFSSIAKYVKRHWPDGKLTLARARELLANCLGYTNVHQAEQSASNVAIQADLADARAAAEVILKSHGRLGADQARKLAKSLPLGDLTCFKKEVREGVAASSDEPILVVEVPYANLVRGWTAKNEADFCEKVKERYESKHCGEPVIERITLREIAVLSESNVDAPEEDNAYDLRLFALAKEHGWDTPLYRSDFINDDPVFGPIPAPKIDELKAYKAALRDVVSGPWFRGPDEEAEPVLFFRGFDEAIRALDDWELWDSYGPEAQAALKNLVAEAGRLPRLIESADIADLDLGIEGTWSDDPDSWNTVKLRVMLRGVPVPTFEKTAAEVLDGSCMWWYWCNWRMDHETQKLAERHLDNLADRFIRENLVPRGVQWPRNRADSLARWKVGG